MIVPIAENRSIIIRRKTIERILTLLHKKREIELPFFIYIEPLLIKKL